MAPSGYGRHSGLPRGGRSLKMLMCWVASWRHRRALAPLPLLSVDTDAVRVFGSTKQGEVAQTQIGVCPR
jgi:hypothetical protein